jgi:hypothetical protein
MLLLIHKDFDPSIGDIEERYRDLIAQYTVGDEFHCYAR